MAHRVWTGPPQRVRSWLPLCQDAAGSSVLGSGVAGLGSDLSEEPVWGCEPVALDCVAVPGCPPGPVSARGVVDHVPVDDVGQPSF